MADFLRLFDYTQAELFHIFYLANQAEAGRFSTALRGKTVALFLPETHLLARVTFQTSVRRLGGEPLWLSPAALGEAEDLQQTLAYLDNWVDLVVLHHPDPDYGYQLAQWIQAPVLQAGSPCAVLGELYAFSQRDRDILRAQYLFCGPAGPQAHAWQDAAATLGLSITQCCPEGYGLSGLPVCSDLATAIQGKDLICTGAYPRENLEVFRPYRITTQVLARANPGALLSPGLPFTQGIEVDPAVLHSHYFVGYSFKKNLIQLEQALLLHCLIH